MLFGVFKIKYKCKNSVRYEPMDDSAKCITGGFYLYNEIFERLDRPNKITIGVEKFHSQSPDS